MTVRVLPIPPHFDPGKVDQVWKVSYQERAEEAQRWATLHRITRAEEDEFRICLMAVDVQNTFCIPGFELFVGGRTGKAAVDDNRRLCEFIYRNLGTITRIVPTMDTHQAMQIFHSIFLVDDRGEHPSPFTLITEEGIKAGKWRINPGLRGHLKVHEANCRDYLLHYAGRLKESGKYDLTIWPYHAMLGGIGHALVSSFEEAVFFHGIARHSQPDFQIKGNNPFTEHYSVLGPEILEGPDGAEMDRRNEALIRQLLLFDAIIIAGQAKSHCVAWTVDDLLDQFRRRDEGLARRVYLLEDCTSSVVVPGAMDYTDRGEEAFRRFAAAGMHLVRSTDPIGSWPDFGSVDTPCTRS